VEGLGREFRILNIYGPYLERTPFWESIFKLKLLKVDNLILGGDLNFSLGLVEVWGPNACPDHLSAMFTHLLSANGLLDIAPRKLSPTWRNMRTGDARVAKHLDHFLVSEKLMDANLQVRQWIGSRGESDHSLIWLVLDGGSIKPPSPFKFNASWLSDESFLDLVKSNWRPYDPNSGSPMGLHFADNLKRIKLLTIPWSREKILREERDLKHTEDQIESIYNSTDLGFLSETSWETLKSLESRHRQLLVDQEVTWRLKSRAIWLEQGDENTKFSMLSPKVAKPQILSGICMTRREGMYHPLKDWRRWEKIISNHYIKLNKGKILQRLFDLPSIIPTLWMRKKIENFSWK
jgi:hypothetical protein